MPIEQNRRARASQRGRHAARVDRRGEARREHVVVYLSGAHAYGFPSPDSDLDLKAIHRGHDAALVGFEPPPPTFDRAEVIDGVEIDYTSNELAHALAGILAGNGNFLERVLGECARSLADLLAELRPLVQRRSVAACTGTTAASRRTSCASSRRSPRRRSSSTCFAPR